MDGQITGDPFVDLGSLVLQTIIKRFSTKNLYEIVELVTDVYIDKWKKKLHSVFHTNSKLLNPNPSTKGKHRENTTNYLRNIIEDSEIEETISCGYCRTCGKTNILYQNSRNIFPNSGSGAFVNFHHYHESGIYLCNKCTFALYFVPLGVILLGKMNAFLHTQSKTVIKYWQENIIEENLNKIARNTSKGILKTEYSNPENALFYFAKEIVIFSCNDNCSEYLQMINFTNYATSPFSTIYVLPNPVFNFIAKVIRFKSRQWHQFVKRYYKIKKSKWDSEKQEWILIKKQTQYIPEENEYRNNPNIILQKLLNNKSILGYLLKATKNAFLLNHEKFPIEITIYYVTEVIQMAKEQIQLIMQITDKIFELAQKENNFKKYIFLLESAGKAYQLRSALMKIIKANYLTGSKEPLIRLEEYVSYLFPDGQYWSEVRDLLLINLYEKMHDNGINKDQIPEEQIEDVFEENEKNVVIESF